MAGKIIADTLETGAGADIATSYVVNGSAKAWANFDTDAVINESFNGSSITDQGTGDFQLSLTNSMSSTDFVQITGSDNTKHFQGSTKTTSITRILTFTNAHSYGDENGMNILVHGDLA